MPKRLDCLLADLRGCLTDDLFLVFDDLQRLLPHPACLFILDYLLRAAPDTLRFILISREPLAGLSHLAGTDAVRIDNSLLAMDEHEVTDFLHQVLHLDVSLDLVREVTRLTGGWTMGVRHYDSQLIGGRVLLANAVAEMETGEGKPLTATLAAATLALAGMPVHVISVNDYLTGRDAEEMGPLYRALGLSVGCVVQGMPPPERARAYGCRITYVTNKEIVFDYLRDRLTLGQLVDPLRTQAESLYARDGRSGRLLLRGLHCALVDEADSILIDEARTPLIISGTGGGEEERCFLEQALTIAGQLRFDDDYRLDRARRQVLLTEAGRRQIGALARNYGPLWTGMAWREGVVAQALSALHLFHRDEHYLVRDDAIEIVDEFTGRVMPGRAWEQGLHQLIEVKEDCPLTRRRDPLAKISYQRFFRRYLRLSGMTGTAREVTGELWSVYGLPTVRIPTHRPMQRRHLPGRILPTLEAKWQAVIERVREIHSTGRPVLIGTRSVTASEHLSRLMTAAGLAHRVLNAKQDREEADIVSRAGEAGKITIATNMAGRGTDIKLRPGVREAGGLHVIATERHEAARIDRQLAGRCGRQSDPGSYEAIVSLADPLITAGFGGIADMLAGRDVPERLARLALDHAQQRMEKYHARIRRELFRQDRRQGSLLSFSGRME
ncbi:preprotein translocase subunit SecA [Desulfobulbus elongatus]|uniref:preprotein translocase subunit SecA n=1 Tax=Desulfobulbus elongatus TaxID=53332 RepID=UPI001B805B6F